MDEGFSSNETGHNVLLKLINIEQGNRSDSLL